MSRVGPKVKLSRALGIPLTPRAAIVMQRKPHPPGQHGPAMSSRRGRQTEYKRQLLEKQRLRAQYNVSETQMRRYVAVAKRRPGQIAERLVQLLEMRLDAVVLRGGIARTIYAARQYVNHRHILVNGKRVDIPSCLLKVGDVVTVAEHSRKSVAFAESFAAPSAVPYLTVSPREGTIRVDALPERRDVPVICELQQVVEYYSR